MDEDHFAHSILPPRPPSKRPFQIVVAAVIFIAASALVIIYWPLLSVHFTAQKPPTTTVEQTPLKPVTTEQKQALYQSAASTGDEGTSTLSASQKQKLLGSSSAESSVEAGSAPSAPQGGLTAEEKQKLFQSTQ